MPLLLERVINGDLRLGVWDIREPEEWFLSHLTLPDSERDALLRLGSKAKRVQRLAYHLVLAGLLGRNDFSLIYDQHGKPHIQGIDGHISVSHSGDRAAAMIHFHRPAGIDIEKVTDRIFNVSERFVSHEECIAMGGDISASGLTLIWSAKEALYKMDGKRGLIFGTDLIIRGLHEERQGRLRGLILCVSMKGSYPLAFERMDEYILVHTL